MGNIQEPARPRTPLPVLTDQPWRQTRGWDQGVRRDLKDYVAGLAPKTGGLLDVSFFKIALTGHIGSGKSSFFNSVNSIYQEHVIFGKAKSLTKEFPNEEILQGVTPGYITSPELKDKAHCVAVVVNGKYLQRMNDDMKRKLKTLRTGLIARNVPTYILLTHIDEVCAEVNKDVTKVYRSIAIRDLVDKVSKMLLGLPENQIFPVINYKSQIYLDDSMDILLLYALRAMLHSAQGYLEKRM